MSAESAREHANTKTFLNDTQRRVIEQVLNSADRIHGLQGLAGSGKTSSLQSVREGAESAGYKVEGFAPTSKAAGQLREAGIEANYASELPRPWTESFEYRASQPGISTCLTSPVWRVPNRCARSSSDSVLTTG